MATNERKTFFLARSFDWPAEGGPVCLGNIIEDPKNPTKVVNGPAFDPPEGVYQREQRDWQHMFDKHRKGSATLFAEFLRMAELSGKPGVRMEKLTAEHFRCDKLVTTCFLPSDKYVLKRMQDPKVQASLKRSRSRAFMITGLKVAYNPAASHVQVRSHGLSIRPGADLALVGPPMKLGVDLCGSTKHTTGTSSDGGTDIVFAYQLMEIDYRVNKRTSEVKVKMEEFIKGAYMDRDRTGKREERREEEGDSDEEEIIEFEKVVEYHVGKEEKEAADDIDGTECNWVFSEPTDLIFG